MNLKTIYWKVKTEIPKSGLLNEIQFKLDKKQLTKIVITQSNQIVSNSC